MGQGQSCANCPAELSFFKAVQFSDLDAVELSLSIDPAIIHKTTLYDRSSPIHIAASEGHLELLSIILSLSLSPDLLNRRKQTPLMMATLYGKIDCVQKLLEVGANILKFDSVNGRTCLHYAAYYGHSDCLQAILFAAQSTSMADSWGFSRYVNVSDGNGATPLHLAAKRGHRSCVRLLLNNGALVCSLTSRYGCAGSSPLHLAARGGSLDCVRELLSWGADRLQRDASGRIPYYVALKRNHGACAALLDPGSAGQLVWPSSLKFIRELRGEARDLLEDALMEANRARETNIFKEEIDSCSDYNDGDAYVTEVNEWELCCICFDQVCAIKVKDCGHLMCAACTLAVCCHNRHNQVNSLQPEPVCPFCRSTIAHLEAAEGVSSQGKTTRFRNLSGGSSSIKGLSSAIATTVGKIGSRCSEKMANASDILVDKH